MLDGAIALGFDGTRAALLLKGFLGN